LIFSKLNQKTSEILSNKAVKVTAARVLVLDVFLQTPYALSLADIEEKLPWSDRVTIYRSLKTFEQKGVIHQINDGSASLKYALCSENSCTTAKHFDIHPHFHCENCGKTSCLEKQEIEIKNLPKHLLVNSYSLILSGLCSECQKRN